MAEPQSDVVTSVCQSGRISETVILAVAEATGVDPLDLQPLRTAIDPDALNALFRPSVGSPPTTVELEFTLEGCHVVVRGDGEVAVTPPSPAGGRTPAVVSSED